MQLCFRVNRIVLVLCLLPVLLVACTGEPESTVKTIGVLNISPGMNPVLEGFKEEMANLGYKEDENIVYIYDGPAGSIENLDAQIADLKTHDLDMVLTFGTPPTQKAEAAFADSEIPIVFGPVNDVVAAGLVTSLANHTENITGVQNAATTAKGVEWFVKTFPTIEKAYVPHNPNDASSVAALTSVQEIAPQLKIELIIREITSNDELTAALAEVPEEADAIIVLRVVMFDARNVD